MADLLSILSASQTSLNAQQVVLSTASQNIDNANNANYARQSVALEAVVSTDPTAAGYVGRGATVGSITQARDRFLESQIPASISSAAQSSAESDALQAIHAFDPGAAGGIDSALSGFYSSLQALSQNPSDAGLQAAAFGATSGVAQAFNGVAGQVETARTGVDQEISGYVSSVNDEAQAVAQLNAQIRQASASGASPNDLLDLRQQHLDTLAQLVGGTPVSTSQGDVNVMVGGVALVSGSRAGTVSTTADPTNGGHLSLAFQDSSASAPTTIPPASIGGSIGGALSARDGPLASAGASLDELAHDFATVVNTANGADPSTGAGNVFSIPSGVSGSAAAMTLAISQASQLAPPLDPNAPGDPTRVMALLGTQSQPVGGAGSPQAALSSIVSTFGAASARAQALSTQDGSLKDNLMNMRASASGVSVDDEMITLQQAERGYEAIAKVIQTADAMMQTVIGLVPGS